MLTDMQSSYWKLKVIPQPTFNNTCVFLKRER